MMYCLMPLSPLPVKNACVRSNIQTSTNSTAQKFRPHTASSHCTFAFMHHSSHTMPFLYSVCLCLWGCLLLVKPCVVDSMDVFAQVAPFSFDSTLLITEADDENSIEKRCSKARYAKHIGLFWRQQWILDSQYCNQIPIPTDCETKP